MLKCTNSTFPSIHKKNHNLDDIIIIIIICFVGIVSTQMKQYKDTHEGFGRLQCGDSRGVETRTYKIIGHQQYWPSALLTFCDHVLQAEF